MLSPDQRALFVESLRPPEGYQFDRGIGTTFTLDLLTLLVAPLSLALLEVEDAAAALQDPVLLLEGVRRYADRLAIFCQAGRIAIPRKDSYLYRFLEGMVVEVQAPSGGLFHPKVWLLRYVADEQEQEPRYRLLVLSRNLTFDRSWDLMLRLEGDLATGRKYAYARNHPLGDFVQHLPEMALHTPVSRILQDIDLLQHEVRRVDFQTPKPFSDELTFYPAGLPGRRAYRFNDHCDRALVVSPFLSDRMLRRITEEGTGHVLISRPDSIGALKSTTRAAFSQIYVLHDLGFEEEGDDAVERVGKEVAGAKPEPAGLHAKLFVTEAGWDATWLIGSANATNAAFFRHNVEFMVELKGRKSKIGIDKILGKGDKDGLRSLLHLYVPQEIDQPVDAGTMQAEKLADGMREWLLSLNLSLKTQGRDNGLFDLLLRPSAEGCEIPTGDVTVTCRPVSLREERGLILDPVAPSLTFAKLDLLALTSFIAFEILARTEQSEHRLRFVLNLPLEDIPPGRQDHIFSAILSDRIQFLRYLRMLLVEREDGAAYWLDVMGTESEGTWKTWTAGGEMPLLEMLLRALSRSPQKIAHIDEIVEGLQRTPQGRDTLPETFRALWKVVKQAQDEIQ